MEYINLEKRLPGPIQTFSNKIKWQEKLYYQSTNFNFFLFEKNYNKKKKNSYLKQRSRKTDNERFLIKQNIKKNKNKLNS